MIPSLYEDKNLCESYKFPTCNNQPVPCQTISFSRRSPLTCRCIYFEDSFLRCRYSGSTTTGYRFPPSEVKFYQFIIIRQILSSRSQTVILFSAGLRAESSSWLRFETVKQQRKFGDPGRASGIPSASLQNLWYRYLIFVSTIQRYKRRNLKNNRDKKIGPRYIIECPAFIHKCTGISFMMSTPSIHSSVTYWPFG